MQQRSKDAGAPARASTDSSRPRFSGKTLGGFTLRDTFKKQALDKPEGPIKKTDHDYFLIGEKLGEGGMGKVYKATSVKTTRAGKIVMEKTVALKVINFDSEYANSSPEETDKAKKDMIERFLIEVQLVAKLEHDNIVRIIDFGETDDGRPFFIMEFLDGYNLEELVNAKGTLSWEETKSIMLQVCAALQTAHDYKEKEDDEGIIHRDIKPLNLFICNGNGEKGEGHLRNMDVFDKKVKVLDFGLAKMVEPTKEGVTRRGEIAGGTPEYMAPEHAWGLKVDNRTDIYAAGAVMYHLLSGEPPIHRDPLKTFHERLWNNVPRPLGKLGFGIPSDAEAIVMKCLRRDPTERFQSVRELAEAMEACSTQDSDPRFQETLPPIDHEPGLGYADTEETSLAHLESLRDRPSPEPVAGSIGGQTDPVDVKKGRIPRKLFAMAAGVILVGGAVGIATQLAGRDSGERPQVVRPASKPATDSRVSLKAPMIEPMMPDTGPEQPDAHAEVKRMLTIRTNVSGVFVRQGDTEVCRIRGNRECMIRRPASDGSVELVFMKPGYITHRQRVVFDEDRTITVRMRPEKRPAKAPEKRPRIISVE